ncbi:MAG: xanthine dehydrogenase family protein subunit M [Planctomycetes bacterium]|nr:xanthine dehydrogenase family protein subunit M [Planctomycetota bacterium]
MTTPRALVPRDLGGALDALAARDPGLRIVAGGTDVMVEVQAGSFRASTLLDIWRLRELRGIRREGDLLSIGALETYTDLQRDPLVRAHLPSLVEASATIGGVQIQNRGTLGGNLANASPAGDALPVLLALDAEVECASRGGTRRVPVREFFLGYRKTALAADEILTRILVPVPAGERLWFRKVGTRAAQAISKVVIAGAVRLEEGRISSVRIAAGAVAPVPIRLPRTERVLAGRRLDPSLAEEAAASAASEVRPIDDVRSTEAYRRAVTGNLLRRWLLDLLAA